jgi:integrase
VLTPKVVPTREQIHAMLAGAPDPRTRTLVAILAYTGMRIGEALSLRWDDWVQPPEGPGRLQLLVTKTGRPRSSSCPRSWPAT